VKSSSETEKSGKIKRPRISSSALAVEALMAIPTQLSLAV